MKACRQLPSPAQDLARASSHSPQQEQLLAQPEVLLEKQESVWAPRTWQKAEGRNPWVVRERARVWEVWRPLWFRHDCRKYSCLLVLWIVSRQEIGRGE